MSERRHRPGSIESQDNVLAVLPPEPAPGDVPVAPVGDPSDSAPAAPAADEQTIDAELAAAVARIAPCSHCGGRHARACPRVRQMQFHPNGALAGVTFWPDGKWSGDHVLWPDEMIT